MPTSLASRPSDSTALEDAVERIRSDRRFDGLLLFGSIARGESNANSDVDLLALHDGPVPDDVLEDIPFRISLAFYTAGRFAELPKRSPLFANHLAREAVVLHDRSGVLSRSLRAVSPIDSLCADRLNALSERRLAEVLDDPSFGPSDLLSASELYALSKQTAFLESARAGLYQFNRHRALDWLGEAVPELSRDVSNVATLEPAWLANRRTPSSSDPSPLSGAQIRSVIRILKFARDH